MTNSKRPSLRRIVKETTGININRCQGCMICDLPDTNEQDIPLGSLIQMILFDDEEVLSSRTLWSEHVLSKAKYACHRGLDLEQVIRALRAEATQRNKQTL